MAESIDPRVLLSNAQRLESAGRLAEAEAAYLHLLARRPDLADTWYNLALLQRRAGRYEAALASYQQALDRGASMPEEIHLNRGVIYADCLRQDAAAEKELNAALAINPNYVPALLNLANLREDFGRREEALSIYERILALDPRCYEAVARYAGLKSVHAATDPLIASLRNSIADGATSLADKASLGFALGKVLDACGAYDQAFDAYVAANQHSRQSARPGTAVYDRQSHERFVDQLIEAFTSPSGRGRAPPRAGDGWPVAADLRPIFICGMFRSGSTLTEQLLGAHSRVTAGGELSFLPSIVRTELAPFPASMVGVTESQLEQLAARYLEMLSRLFPHGDRVTDKRPDNFLYIGLIKRLFPNARIVHTTRNALDNCLSIFFLHLDHGMGYALDLMDTAHYYAQYRRLMSHWKSLYGADILDFDYDTLIREPRPAVHRLLDFCGLQWEEACMDFHRAQGAVKTASVWQVRELLYQRSSGRWRNYATRVEPLRIYLRQLCPDLET
jgi:tetratricopeptide (TPR) repeat protein